MTPASSRLHPSFGVELRLAGDPIDLLASSIAAVMSDERVVRVRGLDLDERSQLEVADALGTIVASPAGRRGRLAPAVRYERGADRYAHRWHADQSWATTNPWTLLYCTEAAAEAEPTLFLDTASAHASIDPSMIARAAGRTVTHDIGNSRRLRPVKGASESVESIGARARRRLLSQWNKRRRGEGEWTLVEAVQGTRDGTHYPLIARCPASGTEHFRVGDHAWDVSGLTTEQAASLLDDIHAELEQSENVVCLDWAAGDLVVFDNRVVLHRRATSGSGDPGRELRRVSVVPDGRT